MAEQDPLVESHIAEVAQTAAVHAETVEKSRAVQLDDAVLKGLETFFNRAVEDGRFIPMSHNRMADKERFQFICDEIAETRQLQEHIAAKQKLAGEAIVQIQNTLDGWEKKSRDGTEKFNQLINDMKWAKWLGGGFVVAAGMLAMKALGV